MSDEESSSIGSAAQEPLELPEEIPMLDVHPQHAALHGWKDFWIHLATITIGLLIAIGLEQSVEALHRLHLRHELETALRGEAVQNQVNAINNFDVFDDRIAWLLGLRRDVDTMLATHGKANLPYRRVKNRPRTSSGELLMATAVWDTVKNNDRLTLLQDELARSYAGNYKQIEMIVELRSEFTQIQERQNAFESRFADLETPNTPVLSRMNREQLEQYAMLISDTLTAVVAQKTRLMQFFGTNEATFKGIYDIPSRLNEQRTALSTYATDFKKLAAQSAADGR
jgi:hypothetical protein